MKKKEKLEKKKKDIDYIVKQIIGDPTSSADPMGSYTGRPVNMTEKPVQDVDDL
jgi:hypothetical protein